VLGIIDKMAAREAARDDRHYRFVFGRQKTLLKFCKRKDGGGFSLDRLKHIFQELRGQHIVSHYFETNDRRYGFVVAPHDSLCCVRKGVCTLPDRSEKLPEVSLAGQSSTDLDRARTLLEQHRLSTVRDTVSTLTSTPSLAPISTPNCDFNNTVRSTDLDTAQSLHLSDCVYVTDDEIAHWFANGMQNGGPIPSILSSQVSFDPRNPFDPPDFSQEALEHHKQFLKQQAGKQKQRQEQNQPQDQERRGVVSSMTGLDKEQRQPQPQQPCAAQAAGTIGTYFANTADILDRLTDGELDPDEYHCTDEFKDWSLLEECIRAAVDAKKNRPYLDLNTNAALMRDTMKTLRKKHGLNAPEPWVPIMEVMQNRTPEMKAEKARVKAAVNRKQPFYTDEEIEAMRNASGRVPCQEPNLRTGKPCVIFRRPEERIEMGFTVLAECTVSGLDSQGRTGRPVWHKQTEKKN